MNKTLSALFLAGTVLAASSPAFAQPPQHKVTAPAATANDMASMCESMMKEMMADPIVRKRMNAIMQKHMSSMMGHGMMQGGMMHGGMMHGGAMHGGAMHGGPMHGGTMQGGTMTHGAGNTAAPQPSPTATP